MGRQTGGGCILGRMAHTQVHAQQQLARELEVGRAAPELQPAPSNPGLGDVQQSSTQPTFDDCL
ncbi:MAG: hypothetical protein ABJX82_08635 [Paracoccaceae bacterium]